MKVTQSLALACALLAFTSLAQAQWTWVNDKGQRQVTDQPPPPGTPMNRILRAPRAQLDLLKAQQQQQQQQQAASEEAAAASSAPEAKLPPRRQTVAERNADYNKRQKEAAEAQAKADAEAQREEEKKRYCASAKDNIATLASGERVSKTGPNGERTFMSDEERAKSLQENRNAYNKICK